MAMDAVQTLIGNRCWMCKLIIISLLTGMPTVLCIRGAGISRNRSLIFLGNLLLSFSSLIYTDLPLWWNIFYIHRRFIVGLFAEPNANSSLYTAPACASRYPDTVSIHTDRSSVSSLHTTSGTKTTLLMYFPLRFVIWRGRCISCSITLSHCLY